MPNSYTAIVNQAIELLATLSNDEYQKQLPPYFSSSIGVHIRHIIDHFIALITGIDDKHVNYNVRHRYNDIEKFPDLAIEKLKYIITCLDGIEENSLDESISVVSEVDVTRTHSTECKSTLERELVFVSRHAIHTYAFIRIMCKMQNKTIPEFFGYAPATITHINKTA